MFGGLELKGSNDKKRDVDVLTVSKDSASTNVTSGFAFLQSSVVTTTPNAPSSGFSFLSSVEPSALPAPEDIAPSNSSFSFISSAPPTPSHGSGALNTNVPTSGFNFVDATPPIPPLSTSAIPSYGDDILSLTAPTGSSTQITLMGSTMSDSDKGSDDVPNPLNAPSHISSSLTRSWGPSVLSETNATAEKGTYNHDDDILTMKSSAQPIGQGIVFGGTAVSKATGAIKKRTRTYKVGTGATLDTASSNNEPSAPSIIESHPHAEPDTPAIPMDDDIAPKSHTRPSTIAEEAEKALQKAAEFIEEKSTEMTKIKSNDTVVKGPLVGTTSQSPNKDLAYQQAVAAAQEAKGIIKQSTGSSFMSGFFKRSGNAPGIPTASNHSSSISNKGSSFIPSIKITSASVDSDTKVYGSSVAPSKVKVESREQAALDSARSPTNNVIEKAYFSKPVEVVQDLEKAVDTTRIQSMVEDEKSVPTVKNVEPVESLDSNEGMANNENKASDESKSNEKYGSVVIPSNRPSSLLDMILNDFFSRCLKTNELIERIKVRQRTHFSDLTAAEKELQLTLYRISQAESHQVIAAEREEFDLAETLASDIEKYSRAQMEQEKILQKAKEAITDLEKQRQSAIDNVALEFREVHEKLTTFKREQETVGRENVTAVIEQFAIMSKRFSAENDRLMSDLKNIERDEAFIGQERRELENQISEQSRDLYQLRDTASDQLEVARKEVEELKKLLAAKEAQVSQLTMVVAQHEASIIQVRSKFSRQITRIEKKETAVKENRNEWEGELATFKKQKEKHEMEVEAHSEYLLSKERIILRAQREISHIDKIEDLIMNKVFVGDVDIGVESASLGDLESSVASLQVAVDEANQGLLAAQADVDRIQDEISSIEAKLPMLEAEKREAAAKRDFKAAGKASKEVKDLTARRDECETILSGESKARLEQAHKNLEKITLELCAKREEIQLRRVEIGRSQMMQVANRIHNLQKLKDEVGNASTKSDELDGDSVISSTACAIIDTRIASLMSLGEQLGITYGGWSEILQESIGDGCPGKVQDDALVRPTASDDANKPTASDANTNIQVIVDGNESVCVTDTNHENTDSAMNVHSDITPITDDIGVEREKAIIRFKEIATTLKILEREVEKAVAEENYEEAAEFEETMTSLRTEMELLGVSETDIIDADDERVAEVDERTGSASSSEEDAPSTDLSPAGVKESAE